MNNKKKHESILEKFGFPNSVIMEYKHWYWLLRPEQITLGSGIIITKDFCPSLTELEKNKFDELFCIYNDVEKKLKEKFNFDKINYLMLMMKDPTLHYHVIPRYSSESIFMDNCFIDKGYPGIPEFKNCNKYSHDDFTAIKKHIIEE